MTHYGIGQVRESDKLLVNYGEVVVEQLAVGDANVDTAKAMHAVRLDSYRMQFEYPNGPLPENSIKHYGYNPDDVGQLAVVASTIETNMYRGSRYFVARPVDDRSKILGFIETAPPREISQRPEADKPIACHIAELVVGTDYQSAGNATRLLHAALKTYPEDHLATVDTFADAPQRVLDWLDYTFGFVTDHNFGMVINAQEGLFLSRVRRITPEHIAIRGVIESLEKSQYGQQLKSAWPEGEI